MPGSAVLRYSLILGLFGTVFPFMGIASTARADDWMFQRSYYSHAPSPNNPLLEPPAWRGAQRDPFVGGHRRIAIRGGWRFNTIVLSSGLPGADRTYIRESWVDINP